MAATIPTNGIVLNSGLNVADGNIVLADGHGISFAATGDNSHTMTTELLDDYEEGTWTPSGASLGVATNHKAIYRKIGDIVFLYCDITMNSSPAIRPTISLALAVA